VVVWGALGCGNPLSVGVGSGASAAPMTEPQAAEIYETVIRDIHKGKGDGDGTYIWVRGKDPTDEVMRRLKEKWPKLRPASAMPEDGYRMDFTEVRRTDAGMDVRFEPWYRGGSSWVIYHLVRKGDNWQVEGVTG